MRYPYFKTYEEDNWYFAKMAKALSHPVRVAIVRFLYDRGEGDYGTMVEHLPLSRASISGHLRILREAGFLKGKAEGKRVVYQLNKGVLGIFENGIKNVKVKKQGVLSKRRMAERVGRATARWFEEIPLGLRTGPYYAAMYLDGRG